MHQDGAGNDLDYADDETKAVLQRQSFGPIEVEHVAAHDAGDGTLELAALGRTARASVAKTLLSSCMSVLCRQRPIDGRADERPLTTCLSLLDGGSWRR